MKKSICIILLITLLATFIGSAYADDVYRTAEMRLKTLAIRREQYRMIDSGIAIGLGIIMAGVGIAFAAMPQQEGASDNYNLVGGLLFVACGGLVAALGISERETPTPLEVSYNEVAAMDSSSEAGRAAREELSANYLKKYSEESFRDRMLSSFVSFGLAAADANDKGTQSGNFFSYLWAGEGLICLLFKSDVENEYDDYLNTRNTSVETTNPSTIEAPARP